jgi:hypothetical protein
MFPQEAWQSRRETGSGVAWAKVLLDKVVSDRLGRVDLTQKVNGITKTSHRLVDRFRF